MTESGTSESKLGWVVVTGASRGIGKSICEELLRSGYGVLGISRQTEVFNNTATELQKIGQFEAHFVDLRDNDASEKFWVELDKSKKIVGLVNNAGIEMSGLAEEVSYQGFNDLFQVNVTSAYFSCMGAFRLMRETGGGSIVNIASVDAHRGISRMAAYCASKASILGLTKALAVEWARHGIRVNSVSPGAISTEMTSGVTEGSKGYEFIMSRTPQRRFAHPNEVAGAVKYLISPGSGFVTGIDIAVDGGFLA
jgi:NAD(P)-dependent dehydrogenase (short-subunit alcohol dehydrogenase family)